MLASGSRKEYAIGPTNYQLHITLSPFIDSAMKRLTLVAFLIAGPVSTSVQGQALVNFNNRVAGVVDAPISYAAGTTLGGASGTNARPA